MGRVRFYERIIESLSSGVLALDEKGILLAANLAAARHLGIPEEALTVGKQFDQLSLPESFVGLIQEIMASPCSRSRQEIFVPQTDGTKKELGYSISLIEGKRPFNGAVFLFVDMTELRRLERAAELNRQLAQIGALTAGVVHELRNPLSVILGMAEVLQRKTDVNDGRRRSADLIVQEARRMADSISQFLGFAKPFELEPVSCDAALVVKRALDLCRHAAARKGVELRTRAADTPVPMTADPGRLGQAIANLVSNAIDVVAADGWVSCMMRADGGDVTFEVTDNGPGIRPVVGDDIFHPFFTKKEGGTGLGLPICHRIITAHGGTIAYENLERGGAKFTVRVPANLQQPEP